MRLQGQNPDAGKDDGDLMSVAKDWAGELISGQTGTGRILVRRQMKSSLSLYPRLLEYCTQTICCGEISHISPLFFTTTYKLVTRNN